MVTSLILSHRIVVADRTFQLVAESKNNSVNFNTHQDIRKNKSCKALTITHRKRSSLHYHFLIFLRKSFQNLAKPVSMILCILGSPTLLLYLTSPDIGDRCRVSFSKRLYPKKRKKITSMRYCLLVQTQSWVFGVSFNLCLEMPLSSVLRLHLQTEFL